MLPDIPLVEVRQDFMTDFGLLARACHLRLQGQCRNQSGLPFDVVLRLDTCAPFSVLPHSVWAGNQLRWQPLGNQLLTLAGQPAPEGLKWFGVPCVLAETRMCLYDEFRQLSRPLRLIAKLVERPLSSPFETVSILGYHFLTENSLAMALHPHRRLSAGFLNDIVGHLTIP